MPETPSERYVAPVAAAQPVTDAVRVSGKPSNLWRDAWNDLRRRPLFWISLAVVLVILVMAVWPTLFTQTLPNNNCELSNSNQGPAAGHPLGFTFQGCDIYARIVWGARTSVTVGVLAMLIGSIVGFVMGTFAGYYGGWLDSLLSRIGDMFFSIPYILAAVVVMTVFSQFRNVFTLALAIGGFAWASTARVVRAEVLRVRQAEFITASRAIGLSKFRTLLSHVVPNSLAPLLVLATLSLAAGIVAESTLSFLGVGMGADVMSWGADISRAQQTLRVAPMSLIYPSIALTITVLAFIMLGELIRDAMDPRARATR
ncbi:MAG: ABC transporter permease [Microbacterium sp.]|nr:ABC transporter permease [Microbacterium sp.]